jgi:hypothetical protein
MIIIINIKFNKQNVCNIDKKWVNFQIKTKFLQKKIKI